MRCNGLRLFEGKKSMARPKSTGSNWAEVRYINGYALFMGFLSMAVRGLGFLVITWTTVVLLGGFVSMLERKDFWCLTLITLIQTAGIFDVHMNEKLSYIRNSCLGFYDTMRMMATRKGGQEARNEWSSIRCLPVICRQFCAIARHMVIFVMASFQALVFAIILCPLAALYTCGLHISGGISLWRLIEHDYGNTDGDPSKANMNPALDVLYGLALLQGALFSYRTILLLASRKVVKAVAVAYGFQGDAVKSVSDYLVTTRRRLAKNPSLSTGRNLVTYAVKLMESESPDDNRSGTKILNTIITYAVKNPVNDDTVPTDDSICGCRIRIPGYRVMSRWWQESSLTTKKSTPHELHKSEDMLMLIQRLLGSPSSSSILHKLLKALGSRSPHPDDTKIRESSARIVAHLAGNIRLNQFPRGIECISSLFDNSGQHDVDGYKELVLQGLRILGKLAADQENCRVMCRTDGLVSKIMRPVSSNVLHRVDHRTWSDIVDASLVVICCLLTTAPEETATKLRDEISSNKATIESMRDIILDCKDCSEERHILAMKVLTELPIENRGSIIGKLIHIFVDTTKNSRIRVLAGEKLVALSFQSQSIALLQEYYYVLAKLLLGDESNKCRISAAGILEGLCSHYKDDEDFENLKNVITSVMPEIFLQILRLESTQVQQQLSDIEDQNGSASGSYNGKNDGQHEEQVALLSLCVMVYEKLISTDQDSANLFLDAAFTFPRELEKMARRNSDPKVAGCLRTLKLIGKMAIAMMRQNNSGYLVQDLESLVGTLESAVENMLGLDGFVLLSGPDDGETLTSLTREAYELVERRKATQE